MKHDWIDGYCESKTGAVHDYQEEWQADRYLLAGKMFAMLGGDKEGKPILTLKCDPLEAELLREKYSYIVPGYYMNKRHWNSVYLEESPPEDLLKRMIDEAHRLLLGSLPKKTQKEILENTENP